MELNAPATAAGVVVNQADPSVAAQATATLPAAPKPPRATNFIIYLFQFIALGFSSVLKNGSAAFDPNSIIDTKDNTVDQTKKVAANAKALEKYIEDLKK